jgi:hypothetical protein
VEQANLALMMKKIFLTIASVALMSNSNVWALAGGPFDNGDPGGLLMERGGFYQCQFSFRNGNGYGIFTPDSYLGGNLPSANQNASGNSQQLGVFNRGSLYTPNSGANALGHNANRSVFYVKGLTYVGGCFGFADIEARDIQGSVNASSNESITQQTLSQNTGGLINASQQAVTQQPLVLNKQGNILNIGWTGKITSTRPSLRFRGKGEITIDTGERTIEQYAITAYSGLLEAIVSVASNAESSGDVAGLATQVDEILSGLESYLGTGEGDVDFDVIPVRVTGNRRFF